MLFVHKSVCTPICVERSISKVGYWHVLRDLCRVESLIGCSSGREDAVVLCC